MTRPMRPLNPDTFTDKHMQDVVRWHNLMNLADRVTAATGLGLADVWGRIKARDYDTAHRRLQEHINRHARKP